MIINIGNEKHDDLCVGIDLGTTNSVLATINVKPNGDIVSKVLEIARAVDMYGRNSRFSMRRDLTLPSCVYYNEEQNFTPIVGDFAKSRYSIRPHLVAKSIKSQMGNVKAEGLSPNIPDKTPAEISAQILKHMLQSAAKTYRQDSITDAVITVPASFDSIMCQATMEAARLAGINIYNRDGSLREILLPEPQAVIYDFVNQVHNGEISNNILDLSTEKNVMVFDLGGGTLDITLHKISRREDAPEILNVEDLAINRYTLLGGDDFDLLLAKAMFTRYLEKYRTHAEIVQKIRREESAVMPQLLSYAEDLKIQVSADKGGAYVINSAWGDEENSYPIGGNINATGYAYDDNFTTQELEKIWRVFMGEEFNFFDFKNLDAVAKNYGTQNIIFPILDVLKKCADKLGTDDFKIDAVIMNGGMSRFYMVIDRLKKFFGFEPIVALNPDQSVARGAAVYHYFRHKYEEKLVANNLAQVEVAPIQTPYINTVQTILPDSLYLVTQGNRYEEIIPTGTKLPYESGIFTGFKLPAKTNKISIPIARKNNDGDYIVIAKGNLNFPEIYSTYEHETFVVFNVNMNEQKILRMNTHTCKNVDGSEILDEGTTEIAIATDFDKSKKILIAPPPPPKIKLKANEVLNNILGNCKKIVSAQKKGSPISNYSANIRSAKNQIFNAANPEDFAEPLIQMFRENGSNEVFKMHCEIIGRKICSSWTAAQRRRLANLCMEQLEYVMTFRGALLTGNAVNTKIQAIYTLSMCGSDEDLDRLRSLHDYKQFKLANLYTHAITKTCVEWIYGEFQRDGRLAMKNMKNHLQQSAHALGTAFRLDDERPNYSSINKGKIVTEMLNLLRSKRLLISEFISCVLAIGLLCDRRYPNNIEQKYIDDAQQTLNTIGFGYDNNFMERAGKFRSAVQKMLEGEKLSVEEEEFLLIKLDD